MQCRYWAFTLRFLISVTRARAVGFVKVWKGKGPGSATGAAEGCEVSVEASGGAVLRADSSADTWVMAQFSFAATLVPSLSSALSSAQTRCQH